jgi:hypothetical protein
MDMGRKNDSLLKDQCGAALVIALIMMIVLTVIGLAASFTSIFETILSGNKRASTTAFYVADGGAQSALSYIQNFSLPGQYDTTEHKYVYDKSTNPNPTDAHPIEITYNPSRSGPPRNSKFSATGQYEFMYYEIESKGEDQTDFNPNKANCTVQESVLRLVPTEQ